jgi:hypothetical protein
MRERETAEAADSATIARGGSRDLAGKLAALVAFGTGFAFVEAAVVYYLRTILGVSTNYILPPSASKPLLNLGAIAFIVPPHPLIVNSAITRAETIREAATLVMLIAVGYLAGSNRRGRVAAFWVAFAAWDLGYYLFLKLLTGWPSGLMTKDIYFLIPVAWIGPVLTPVIISTGLLIWGARSYMAAGNPSPPAPSPARGEGNSAGYRSHG